MGEKVKGEKKAAAEGGEKKATGGEESSVAVVLKLDLHCEGCAKKVRKAVSQFEGVEKVKADFEANKLTVTANVDPTWLREKVEHKTKKEVTLVSPTPKKDDGAGDKKTDQKSAKKSEEKKKGDDHDKKPKEPAVSTAVMKIKLHCDGCAAKIKRAIKKKIDGVSSVTTNLQEDLVTVTGTMNVKDLTSYLQDKVKRSVDIVPPIAAAGDKKEGKKEGAGGDKKEGKKEGTAAGDEATKVEVSKMEYQSLNPHTYYAVPPQMYGGQDYGVQVYHNYPGYANHGYGYTAEYRQGPPPPPPTYMSINDQMFSDENPNGCSVM